MNASYEDIRKKIKEEPLWFDTNGVPRYDKFHPSLSPNIYADEVILLEIACQRCGVRFEVEMNGENFKRLLMGEPVPSFTEKVRKFREEKAEFSHIHYGDPPFHGCVGDTMNCIDLRVLQFWKRSRSNRSFFRWMRIKNYEIKLEDEED